MSQGQQSRSLRGGLMKVGTPHKQASWELPSKGVPGAARVPALNNAANPKASRVTGPSFSCDSAHGDTLCRHFYQTL